MTITPKGYVTEIDADGVVTLYEILVMDAAEILEREELNINNTSGKMRARVLRELALTNGHGEFNTKQ